MYNSENTHILATHMQGDNRRMLLLHITERGRHEYVIGSYFQESLYQGGCGYMKADYSWDWGHYFEDVVEAVDYWKRVLDGTDLS